MAFELIKEFGRRMRGLFQNGFMRSIREIAQNSNVTSDAMMEAIDLWLNMYGGNSPWLSNNPQTLKLPVIISSEMARQVTLEMEVNFGSSPMDKFIDEQFGQIRKDMRTNVEYACAGGGIVFKPYVNEDKIVTEIVHANMFYPFAFNSAQEIVGAYFIYRRWKGKKVYSRLERHELVGTTYNIKNSCYVSAMDDALGKPCLLSEIDDWADIQEEVVIQDIDYPLFAYFKIPLGNTVDINSPLGCSVYSRAIGLIQEADKQFQRYLWEYEGGELAIDASEDAFKHQNGIPVLPEGKERLFRTNNLDITTASGGELLKAWTPTLRDSNYQAGLNNLLMRIEDACGLSRGTLAEVTEVARTATELKIMKQRAYATITDIQKSLESALDHLAYAMYSLAVLYELMPDGEFTTSYIWDDSIIVDAETERVRDQQEVSQGIMQKYEYRMKWYGEDEATAKKKLGEKAKTDEEILFGEPTEGEGNNNPNKPTEGE